MWRGFTDGACQVHTSKCGGVGVVVFPPVGVGAEVSSFHACHTTAQKMELEAVAEALDMTPPRAEVLLTTDSQYAYHATMGDWKLKENLDTIERIHRLAADRKVSIVWKPRNTTDEMREVDYLAKKASEACPKLTTA